MRRSGLSGAVRRALARRLANGSDSFRAAVIAPYLDDWRREQERARRRGSTVAAWAVAAAYLLGLPRLWLAYHRDRRNAMSSSLLYRRIDEARVARLGARFLYVAAIALLPLVSGVLGRLDSAAEVVSLLVLALLLALGLVTVGLLVEERARRPAREQPG